MPTFPPPCKTGSFTSDNLKSSARGTNILLWFDTLSRFHWQLLIAKISQKKWSSLRPTPSFRAEFTYRILQSIMKNFRKLKFPKPYVSAGHAQTRNATGAPLASRTPPDWPWCRDQSRGFQDFARWVPGPCGDTPDAPGLAPSGPLLAEDEVSHAEPMGLWSFWWWLVPLNDYVVSIVSVNWAERLAVGYKLAFLICDYINMHGGSVPFSLHTSHQCTSMRIHPLLAIHPDMSCTNRRFEARKTIFLALRAGFEAFVIKRIIHKHRDCRHCSSTNILIIRKSFPGSKSQQC